MMKRVVVVGASGYIGGSFLRFAEDSFVIDAVSSRNGAWKSVDFSLADSVLFAAGIAHRKQTKRNKEEYFLDKMLGISYNNF